MIDCLPPFIPDNACIVILGSMPGNASLQHGEYYSQQNNQFWRLLATVFNEEMGVQYAEKTQFLALHGIALWDVFHTCDRAGSLDSAITSAAVNDFADFFSQHPAIRRILLNGRAAEEAFRAKVAPLQHLPDGLQVIYVPSSSPTPGRNVKTFDEKVVAWRAALL